MITRFYSTAFIAAAILAALAIMPPSAFASAGPVGYWAFEEGAGTTAFDSANGNNGAISGGAAYAAAAPTLSNSSALAFDGVDDYAQITDNAALDLTGSMSVSGWVKTSDSGTQVLARKTFAYEIFVYNGHLGALLGNGATWSGGDIVEGSVNIVDGNWHHVATTYDDASNTLNLYVDGVLDVSNAAYPVSLGANAFDMYFGAWNDGTGSGFYLAGDLDEMQLYDRVLDANEISILAAATNTLYVDNDGQVGFGSIDCDGVGVGVYSAIASAVTAASAGDTIRVCPGTYAEGQIIIDKNLTISGDTSKPVIQPSTSLTADSAAGAWLLVDGGVTFNIDHVVFDGSTNFVHQALRSHGNTTVDAVDFMYIRGSVSGSPYRGVAIQSYGGTVAGGAGSDSHGAGGSASHLIVTNSTFANIGRIGILIKGTASTANISSNTYTGKGSGDWLDYGFEAGAGGSMTVEGNTVNGNTGVASDGSASAGILVTTYWGAGTSALIEKNNLTGNTEGVTVGYDTSDTSDVEAHRNNISGNATTGVSSTGGPLVDATCNWWGSASGPGPVGPGTGDSVSASVDFISWLTTSDLINDPCTGIPTVTVTIVKYIEGAHAGTTIAQGLPFPMDATWSAANIGAGAGSFDLDADGFNNPNPYEATTAEMAEGADYSAEENLTGPNVGASCTDGKPFAFSGYSVGDSELAAAAAATSSSAVLTNITSDKFIIVWNDDCTARLTLQKTVVTDNGGMALDTDWTLSASGPTPVSGAEGDASITNAPVLSGTYTLSESGGPSAYTASNYSCIVNGGTPIDGNSLTLVPGDVAVCTITNDDAEPSLTLQKVVINNSGGSSAASDWTLTAAGATGFSGLGPIVASGASFDAGTYDLSESGPAGYDASAWVCVGGTQTDSDTIMIAPGENVLCTITNNDTPPPTPPQNACETPLVAPIGYTLQNGTAGNDNLVIAPFTMFVGNGGNDKVRAGNSSYIICLGGGKDTITLNGTTTATIDMGDGDNTITGPAVIGYIKGGSGKDTMTVGHGAKTIVAGEGKNTIITRNGDQNITTGNGDDRIITGNGNDTIFAGDGKNVVMANEGDDTITTLDGKDTINGGPGTDVCNAGGGSNTLLNCAP